jgi:hypothetical protein
LIAYVLSWCVPVVESTGEMFGGRYWGWQALAFAMSPLLGGDPDANWFVRVVMVGSALSNVLYLGIMLHAFLRPARDRRAGRWALVGATLLNASWPMLFDMRADLRLGYYLWVLAFPLGAAGAGRRVGH